MTALPLAAGFLGPVRAGPLSLERRDGSTFPIRHLHRPEHDLGEDRPALAAVRAAGIRERVALRPPDPAQPPGVPLLLGLDAAGGAGRPYSVDPDRGARHLEHFPLPVSAGQGSGDRRPHLKWAPRLRPRSGLVGGGAAV